MASVNNHRSIGERDGKKGSIKAGRRKFQLKSIIKQPYWGKKEVSTSVNYQSSKRKGEHHTSIGRGERKEEERQTLVHYQSSIRELRGEGVITTAPQGERGGAITTA